MKDDVVKFVLFNIWNFEFEAFSQSMSQLVTARGEGDAG